jgi:hypothetical protein
MVRNLLKLLRVCPSDDGYKTDREPWRSHCALVYITGRTQDFAQSPFHIPFSAFLSRDPAQDGQFVLVHR